MFLTHILNDYLQADAFLEFFFSLYFLWIEKTLPTHGS